MIVFKLRSSIAQTTPELILPKELHGTVKLNTSFTKYQNKKISDYEKLAVFVKNEVDEYVSNAIQGQYTNDGKYLIFKPYFPFESGMTYIIRMMNEKSNDKLLPIISFQIGKKEIVEEAKVIKHLSNSQSTPRKLIAVLYLFQYADEKKTSIETHKIN